MTDMNREWFQEFKPAVLPHVSEFMLDIVVKLDRITELLFTELLFTIKNMLAEPKE